MQVSKRCFLPHGDEKGQLVALEEFTDVPFQIRRVYYMYGTGTGVIRGCHAHKTLQQVLICIHGSCRVRLDNGKEDIVVSLDQPNEGLFIPCTMWRELFDFSSDAVVLVLASELYDKTDYIRNYDDFLVYIKEHGQAASDGRS